MDRRDARPGQPVIWRTKRGKGFVERKATVEFVPKDAGKICLKLPDDALVYAAADNVHLDIDR